MSSRDSAVRAVRAPTSGDLAAARTVVEEVLAPTPLVRIAVDGVATEVYAKLETLQPTGSFKVRGALAACAALSRRGTPVVTASAGNHGLGIAYAAARLGIAATVVVPETASPAKIDALRRLGANLVLHGDGYDAAEQHALRLADGHAAFVSAYNDPHVIAGQATCLTEVRRQLPGGFTVAVAIGGGGLLAGTLLAADSHDEVRVVGVESAASRALSAAVAAGRIIPVRIGATLADGLAGNLEPGCVTPALAAARDVRLTAVTEPWIAAAVRHLALRCGLVVEGAGAVGVAALLGGLLPTDRPVVVLLTGRNIAPAVLTSILDGGDPPMTPENAPDAPAR